MAVLEACHSRVIADGMAPVVPHDRFLLMTETVTPRRVRVLSGALDQFFSSVSNGFIIFALGVVASPDEFGYVSILMMSLLAVMVCLRGGLGLPLLHKADQSADVVRREGSLALTTALIASVLVLIPALILLPKVGMAAVAIAVSAPFVLGQDVCRYVLMAIGRPQIAALWDGAWFVGTLLVLVGSWLDLRFITTSSVLAAWGFFGGSRLRRHGDPSSVGPLRAQFHRAPQAGFPRSRQLRSQ